MSQRAAVLFVIGSELARVARQVSSELPIVVTPGDPVAGGLVASLAHPGGNTTAMTFEFPDPMPDAFTTRNRELITSLANRYRLPAIYPFRFFATGGGLMSYGVDSRDLFRRAASYVDRILNGAQPGELPVQAPTTFELVVNLKTAMALGITIPPSIVLRADEVIE